MAKGNRDEFSSKIKMLAAQRTGYRCSICSISTIGPSHESASATTSIGEASHICAAAPQGKRYDPNMTPEERSSIDNCIWMCKIHARIIDRDDVTYTVAKLKEIKQKAERYAEEAISEVDVFRNQYNLSGDDISSLKSHFTQMINEGSYDLLRNMLESYFCTISSVYDEFVLRFKLIYDMYCNHTMIDEHMQSYLELPNKAGVDDLLEIAIPFNLENVVRTLLPFAINSEIQKIAQLFVEGKLEDSLIGSTDLCEPFEISKEKYDVVNNFVIHRAIARNICKLQNIEGKEVEFTSKEAYYNLLLAAHRLIRKIIYDDVSIKTNPKESDFWELKKNIHIISQLDVKLQDFLWEVMLQFAFNDRDVFDELIKELPLCAYDMPKIARTHWLYRIVYETSSVNVEELLSYSSKSENYILLGKYLWLIPEPERYMFLKQHLYLCNKSSRFLRILCEYEEKYDLNTIQLSDYESIYRNDFLYMCLKYKDSKDELSQKEIVEWLIKHQDLALMEDLYLYLDILRCENKWEEIVDISTHCTHNEQLFQVANLLAKNGTDTYNKKALQIYENLEAKGWSVEDLFFNIAVVSVKSGKTEKAKKYLIKEYDSYGSQTSLFYLLQLRIDTNDVRDDKYLYDAKNILTRDFQNIVAASYERLMNHTEAKLYVLRTLLIDDTAGCVGALFSLSVEEEVKEPEYVQNDCICVLESQSESLNLAIHSDDVLKGISPNNFADCTHFSVGDPAIASLMYHKKEDVVEFKNARYKVAEIKSTSSFFASYALRQIVARKKGVKTIQGNTAEEAITNIASCLRESQAQTDNILNSYNTSTIRYPVSILSLILGKDCIDTCSFLALSNSEKIRNNRNVVNVDDEYTYILSLDSIVNLTLLNFNDALPKVTQILCPRQVKNCLLSEISKMADNLNSKRTQGSIHLVDNRVQFMERTVAFRQDRYAFLASIRKLVNLFPDVEAFDFDHPDPDLESLFVERKMDVEAGTLALLQNTPNAVLITDDQFLYSVANMMGYNTMGLCGFFTGAYKDSRQLIDISKRLKSINFSNYLPLFMFDKIVDCLPETQPGESSCDVSVDLTKWLISDRENEEATDHHREVILQLYRDCVTQEGAQLSAEYPLTQIAVHHFARLHPEYVKQLLKNLFINGASGDDFEVEKAENNSQ